MNSESTESHPAAGSGERLGNAARSIVKSPAIPADIDRLLKRLARRRRRISGLPPILTFELLDELCQEEWNRPLRATWYAPISGWKRSSAAFVWLQMTGRKTKRVVIKASRYDATNFPAAVDSPLEPGPPEFWVYQTARPALVAHLAHCYIAARSESGGEYVYVLEDLTADHHHPRGTLDWQAGITGLALVQSTLASAVNEFGGDRLLRYDRDFSENLLSYAEGAIAAFHDATDLGISRETLANWTRIRRLYLAEEFDNSTPATPIHGDYNTGNVFIPGNQVGDVKAVDWEWAGFGTPHADLASLLKKAPPEAVTWAIEQLAERNRTMSHREHQRMFLRSVLERAIWDSALVSLQFTSDVIRFHRLQTWVTSALERSLRVLDELDDSR